MDDVTRGEMAAFITRARGLPAATDDYFDDDDGHLFERDINALAQAGITDGCGDGTSYCPDDEVTRGQMAKFLRRAGDLPTAGRDSFADDGDSVFQADINAIAADGVTSGCNPPDYTRYCPEETTTRAQMATFIGRLLDFEPITPPAPEVREVRPRDLSAREAIEEWFGDGALYDQAVRVARCESSLNPRAVNYAGGWHGLFQIAERYHRSAFERVTGQSWSDGIYTAYYNAQYARNLYDRSGGWGPWGCRP